MTTTPEISQDKAPTKPQKQPSQPRGWTILLLIIAVGCTAYAAYVVTQCRQGTTQQLQGMMAKLSAINAQQTDTVTRLDSTRHQVSMNQDQLTLLDKQMHTQLQQQAYRADDWALLKARYFLELAQANAYWTDNMPATSALLGQADTVLENAHEQRLFDVRREIAEEKARVDAVEKIDTTGILSQLDAAQQLTQHLLIHQVLVLPNDKSAITPQPEQSSSWRERLKTSLELLEKLVVVRRVNEDVKPLMTPAYVALLRESIQLMLQEAQLAVLQRDEALYQLALKQAINKVTQLFDRHDSTTEALLKQLKALTQTTLLHEKVEIGRALVLLNQVIDSKPEAGSVVEKSS